MRLQRTTSHGRLQNAPIDVPVTAGGLPGPAGEGPPAVPGVPPQGIPPPPPDGGRCAPGYVPLVDAPSRVGHMGPTQSLSWSVVPHALPRCATSTPTEAANLIPPLLDPQLSCGSRRASLLKSPMATTGKAFTFTFTFIDSFVHARICMACVVGMQPGSYCLAPM